MSVKQNTLHSAPRALVIRESGKNCGKSVREEESRAE